MPERVRDPKDQRSSSTIHLTVSQVWILTEVHSDNASIVLHGSHIPVSFKSRMDLDRHEILLLIKTNLLHEPDWETSRSPAGFCLYVCEIRISGMDSHEFE